MNIPKFGKKERGGLAFFVGWIGSSYVSEAVFDYHLNGWYCFLIGLFMYAIFSGAYDDEGKTKQAEQTEKQGD